MEEYKFRRGKYEMIAAKGKMPNNTRPLFIFGVYLPPKMKADSVRQAMNLLSEAILRIKSESAGAYILIGGDFNGFDTTTMIGDYDDIDILPSPPTRNNAKLDIIASSFNADIVDSSVFPPLSADNQNTSDHQVLVVRSNFIHKHDFKWIRYKTRQISPDATRALVSAVILTKWEDLLEDDTSPSRMTELTHEKINELMDEHLPYKERKIRSTDDP